MSTILEQLFFSKSFHDCRAMPQLWGTIYYVPSLSF